MKHNHMFLKSFPCPNPCCYIILNTNKYSKEFLWREAENGPSACQLAVCEEHLVRSLKSKELTHFHRYTHSIPHTNIISRLHLFRAKNFEI